ncbi:hypothetical protein JW935_01470 [candidate division KSB1 bacterium]|nr:hypothetical protein [candidate division KSB1 bacterium]
MVDHMYDTVTHDPQGTSVKPVDPPNFDVVKYVDYEAQLLERTKAFMQKKTGIAVCRRFRIPDVFMNGCRDMGKSLALQLGALEASMQFKMDIPNFLEPWYGIGTVASAFGCKYRWEKGNAPAVKAPFLSVEQALKKDVVPIRETEIGRHTLNMIESFLEKTGGKIPVSLTDTQSAINAASFIVETNNFYMEMFDNPAAVQELVDKITDLTIKFSQLQQQLIGDAVVWPGHGFSSARNFTGLGMSSDVVVMLSGCQYETFEQPCIERAGAAFNGAAFHSCGNWSGKVRRVRTIKYLFMVDAAFSKQTDPDPNPVEPFVEIFAGTNIIVNARIVGDEETVVEKARALYQPGMKLIVVTYCQSPEEQARVYDRIHALDEGQVG